MRRDGILAYARKHLAAYKIPRAVNYVADLAMTSSGKIKRRELVPPDVPPSRETSELGGSSEVAKPTT